VLEELDPVQGQVGIEATAFHIADAGEVAKRANRLFRALGLSRQDTAALVLIGHEFGIVPHPPVRELRAKDRGGE
jgi:hypothetical protein